MTFTEKIKTAEFWKSFLKIAIPFFIAVILISLVMNSWRDIFNADFSKVAELNFNEGKWKRFFGIKIIMSVIYGVWVTQKNSKK